jgi:hypothetical protein
MTVHEEDVVVILEVEWSGVWRRRRLGQQDSHSTHVTGKASLPVGKTMIIREINIRDLMCRE